MSGSQDRYELDRIEEELKELKSVFEIINKQTVAIEKLVVEMKFMREDHIKLDRRIKELESKPIKQWDAIVSQIISIVIAAVVGFILARIGLK